MVKAPTKHGLDRKFKPWRRGKSATSNKRSSLKQQLRGAERLLAKLPADAEEKRLDDLKQKIESLKSEIAQKQQVVVEKKHAEKSHGQRFMDRQRLTRQEKQVRKQQPSPDQENMLRKLALDQVYVAHHPNDVKYMPLFRKGTHVVDVSRQMYRRFITRRRILRDISQESHQSCAWIPEDQYSRLPKEWSVQDEEQTFGGSMSRQKNAKLPSTDDSRFKLDSQHDELLKFADKANADLKDEGSSSHERSSDDEKPNAEKGGPKGSEVSSAKVHDSDSSSDSDDSSVDSDADGEDAMASRPSGAVGDQNETSSDSSDSDDSSDDNSGTQDKPTNAPIKPTPTADESEELDDFLMDATTTAGEAFSTSTTQIPAFNDARGDKSRGWETQRQRPGQYKKRRTRR